MKLGLEVLTAGALFFTASALELPKSYQQPVTVQTSSSEFHSTQKVEENLSQELSDLLETNKNNLPGFDKLNDPSMFMGRGYNTRYGALAYKRFAVDKKWQEEAIKIRKLFGKPIDQDSMLPLGYLEDKIYLYPKDELIYATIVRNPGEPRLTLISDRKDSYMIFFDPKMSGQIGELYDGPQWHHGVPREAFRKAASLDKEESIKYEKLFKDELRLLISAIREYLSKNSTQKPKF